MTLGVLPTYRRTGIGSKLLDFVLNTLASQHDAKQIQLHVHVANDSAIAFYEKHGFVQGEKVANYYSADKFDDPSAVVLTKTL